MAVAAAASASVGNKAIADAVAGAQAHGQKGKADFADVLSSLLSGQTVQPQATTQDNIPAHKQATPAQVTDTLSASAVANSDIPTVQPPAATTQSNIAAAHRHAVLAQLKDALNASTAANGDTTNDSADAIAALAAKMTGTNNTNAVADSGASSTDATPQTTATAARTAHAGKYSGVKHAALTAATQAKLVPALAHAATAPAKIVGSDGKTAASSTSDGTPATTDTEAAQALPAQTETPDDIVNILAAMQKAQPVVTTVETNADKTEATVTPRTMTQLEKAALGNTAQQTLHSPAPVAKTEAQALSIPADAKSANTQSGSGQKQARDSDSARLTASADKTSNAPSQPAAVPDAPQATTGAAAVVQTAANTAANGVASAIGNSTSQAATAAPTTIATTLQVAQQTTASTTTPDLAALAVSIAAKSKDGQNEFNIRMDPAELGRVDVRLSVDAAGKAQAHLTADKPQTLALLQRDSQTLERSLKDSGLDLSNNGLNFSLKGEQQSSTPTFVARNRALSIASVQTTDTASSTFSTSNTPGDSRLDIRV